MCFSFAICREKEFLLFILCVTCFDFIVFQPNPFFKSPFFLCVYNLCTAIQYYSLRLKHMIYELPDGACQLLYVSSHFIPFELKKKVEPFSPSVVWRSMTPLSAGWFYYCKKNHLICQGRKAINKSNSHQQKKKEKKNGQKNNKSAGHVEARGSLAHAYS